MRSERTGSAGALRSLLEAAEIRPWSGDVWRCHGRRYAADDATGSLLVTGRFHPGRDRFSEDDIWPALYTGLALHVALGERLRHTTPATLSKLAHQTISQLHLELGAVLVLC
ncbi:MAG: RES family NAD+ phosphorylase, partial [Thermomicrobiales bacterium]|nr:RES family NAD+ phosphorylase [Thermomicrobiales bacterium]